MKPLMRLLQLFVLILLCHMRAQAHEITTNSALIHGAPKWLAESRVNRVVDKIQNMLEWDIRRVEVYWHSNEEDFAKAHGLNVPAGSGSVVMAVSKKNQNAIHIGPRVDASTFDGVFGHELGHIIIYQKYKEAIPNWLEEGLCNFAAKPSLVDYKWLSKQTALDVRTLGHPFGKSIATPRYHYMASTAAMELLASKCGIHDLLQLSVGQKLEGYLSTFCQISDLNSELKKWVERKSR